MDEVIYNIVSVIIAASNAQCTQIININSNKTEVKDYVTAMELFSPETGLQ